MTLKVTLPPLATVALAGPARMVGATGTGVTVSSAAALSTEPLALLATARNRLPLSERLVAAML